MVDSPRFHTTLRLVDRRVVVVKIARGNDVALLRHEADMLAQFHHHGIVPLVATGGRDVRFGMATTHAGTHTLHTAPTPSLPDAVSIAGQLLGTIADLHAMGITHGRIEASHVVVGHGHRAVLCGFRGAGELDTVGIEHDTIQATALCTSLITSAATALPRRNRPRHRELVGTCLAVLADRHLGAAVAAQRLHSALTLLSSGPAWSLQAHGHLVGQQSAGDGQDQRVPVLDHQSIKHTGQIVGRE